MRAVLHGGLVGEGDCHGVLLALVAVFNVRRALLLPHPRNVERRVGILARPAQKAAGEGRALHALVYHRVVGAIDDRLGVLEQKELFVALLLHGGEVFLMRRPDVRHQADGRLNDILQGRHFAHLRNARLEQGHLRLRR